MVYANNRVLFTQKKLVVSSIHSYADHENAVLSEDGWAGVKCNIIQPIENARTKQKVKESLLLAEGKMKQT